MIVPLKSVKGHQNFKSSNVRIVHESVLPVERAQKRGAKINTVPLTVLDIRQYPLDKLSCEEIG